MTITLQSRWINLPRTDFSQELHLHQPLRVRANPCVRGEGADRGEREEPTNASSSTQKGFNSARRIEPLWVREC